MCKFEDSVVWFVTGLVIGIWFAIFLILSLFRKFKKSEKITSSWFLGCGIVVVLFCCILLIMLFSSTFIVAILVSLPSIFTLILLAFVKRFIPKNTQKIKFSLNSGFLHYVIGCAVSFLLTLAVLDIVTVMKFRSKTDILSHSNFLVLHTSIPRKGFPALPWEKEITDLQTIKKLSSILTSCRYRLTYSPGLPATTDWIEVNMYHDEEKTGKFICISGDLDLGFLSIKYVTSEVNQMLHTLILEETNYN